MRGAEAKCNRRFPRLRFAALGMTRLEGLKLPRSGQWERAFDKEGDRLLNPLGDIIHVDVMSVISVEDLKLPRPSWSSIVIPYR